MLRGGSRNCGIGFISTSTSFVSARLDMSTSAVSSQTQSQQQQNIALEDLSVEQLSQVKQQLDEVRLETSENCQKEAMF